MKEYFEGEECPFCGAEYDDFFSHTDGMGSAGDLEHFYICGECGKEWVNRQIMITEEVK